MSADAFEREVLRINARYNEEVVERFGLCPYARPARAAGSSVRLVCAIREPDVDAVLAEIVRLEGEPHVEVGQIVMPQLALDARAYVDFIARVGERNAARFPAGKRPVFVHAAFHPELPYDTDTGPKLVPFFRRSPDPLMQVVRLAVLDALHATRPRGTAFFDGTPEELMRLLSEKPAKSITERITDDNHRAALAGMLDQAKAAMADIAADRARAYAAVGRP